MEKEKQVVGDNRTNDFQGFVLDDSPKTVEEQLAIIGRYLERSAQEREKKGIGPNFGVGLLHECGST